LQPSQANEEDKGVLLKSFIARAGVLGTLVVAGAALTGAARETVSVTLRELRRDGTVERVGRTYVLKLSPYDLG